MFIKYGHQIDAGTLLILNDIVEFMEQAADMCADTARAHSSFSKLRMIAWLTP
jgi:hypothetical protein